jgi:large subunit ribosomal protein L22
MEAIARAKNVKISSQKAKLVMDLIRGRLYSDARDILKFTNKRAAGMIYKVLESARANAVQLAESENIIVDVDELWVKECYVNIGTTKYRRRVRPAPMGRAYRERRHYSHLTVVVSSDQRKEKAKEQAKASEIEKLG